MNKKEIAEIVFFIPGRIRLKYGEEKSDVPDLDKLLQIRGVEEVTFNKITQSLLIIYKMGSISQKKLIAEIEEKLPGTKIRRKKKGNPEDNPGGPDNPDNLRDLLGNLLGNSDSIGNTGNPGASKSSFFQKIPGLGNLSGIAGISPSWELFVPLALALWGLEELLRKPVMPKWNELLWYSYSLFLNLNKE